MSDNKTMSDQSAPTPGKPDAKTAEHITEAHRQLKSLRERLDRHPELEQAIEQLEMALARITVKTGGLL